MAKMNGWTKWVISSIAAVALIVLTWVFSAGRITGDVEANAATGAVNAAQIEKVEVRVNGIENKYNSDVSAIKTDVEWIKKGIKRIEDKPL